jgi:hypothetical protein
MDRDFHFGMKIGGLPRTLTALITFVTLANQQQRTVGRLRDEITGCHTDDTLDQLALLIMPHFPLIARLRSTMSSMFPVKRELGWYSYSLGIGMYHSFVVSGR